MEWCSNGVMYKLLIESLDFAFSNTPMLHDSSTPKPQVMFTDKAVEFCSGPDGQSFM